MFWSTTPNQIDAKERVLADINFKVTGITLKRQTTEGSSTSSTLTSTDQIIADANGDPNYQSQCEMNITSCRADAVI